MRRCRRNTRPSRTSEASEPSPLSLLAGQILNGIATGMLYALMGLGLSLITGILNIPNFAHGALFAVGAYLLVTAVNVLGNFWIGLVVAPLGVALLGLAIEYAGIRRLYAAGHDYQLLFTFGLSLILAEGIILVWGPVGISHLPPEILRGGVDLGFTFYPKYRLFVMAAAGLLVFLTWLFLEKTRYGAIMRAGIENKEMVSLLGIDIHRLFTAAFALGAYLAGIAGALTAPIRGLSPGMGVDMLGIAFVVVALGGLGNLLGAIGAGLLIGVAQAVAAAYVAGWLLKHYGIDVFLALGAGVFVGAASAAAVGYLCVQRSGLYFIMLTFALNQLFYFVAYQWTSVTGGEDGMPGIPRPAFLGIDFNDPFAYYVFVSALFIVSLWIMRRIVASPLGKILQAIREHEVRAEAVGYDVARFKLAAFVIGGAFSGAAGVLYAMLFGIVPLEAIGFVTSGNVVFATLIGGSGSLYGPIIGSFVFIWLSESVSTLWARWPLLLGVAFVIVVLFFRGEIGRASCREGVVSAGGGG